MERRICRASEFDFESPGRRVERQRMTLSRPCQVPAKGTNSIDLTEVGALGWELSPKVGDGLICQAAAVAV